MIISAKAELPLLSKGHDRTVLLDDIGYYAVFDGANNAIASGIASDIFETARNDEVPPSLASLFKRIQTTILHRTGGAMLTTATAVALGQDDLSLYMHFAHAGDSALYVFDHQKSVLTRQTQDEAPRRPDGKADGRQFLGSEHHTLRQYGRLALPNSVTLVLFTDGIADGSNREGGVSDKVLHEIVAAELEPAHTAQEILDASSIDDDRSVAVIKAEFEAPGS